MKKKELKKLAQKIAELELIASSKEHDKAQEALHQIIKLTGKIKDPEDLFYMDELIQDILKDKKS